MTIQMECTCGDVEVQMEGEPKVRGFCHCGDCRELLNVPFHSVNAWEKDRVSIVRGAEKLSEFKHPRLNMKKFSCQTCHDVLFNSNGMDWRVFSQLAVAKSFGGELPENLRSKSHFYYGRRIVTVDDELPKRD